MQNDNFLRRFDKNAKIITFDTFLKIFEGLKIGCRGAYCIPRICDALCKELKAGVDSAVACCPAVYTDHRAYYKCDSETRKSHLREFRAVQTKSHRHR